MILTLEQLEGSLDEMLVQRYWYWPAFSNAMQIYRLTGCRSSELLDRSRWDATDIENIILTPLKGNEPRYFVANVLWGQYLAWLIGRENDFAYLNTNKLERFFNNYYRYPLAMKGNKQSCLYLFRYAFVKRLYADTGDLSLVTSTMGWHDESIALGYINAQIIV